MEKDKMSDLINQAKASSQVKTIQKVMPIKVKQEDEIQFSFYLPKKLLREVKLRALEEDLKIKEVINDALHLYLKSKSNSSID
ncbi:hypothetical protein [Gelidibacter mesophilus]|uniref:hypothetical protein n=1 Tax=Gelidibacter mesophilus TaxID=169050 RepID=UPI000400B23F|nr:hypothetical protein [Gelidibacter mesophilus]